MSVTLNAKGTSVPYFTIGKSGITMYQGIADPVETYTIRDGDYWLNKGNNSINVWSTVTSSWEAPRLADLHFDSTSIIAAGGQDLILSVDQDKNVIIDSGNSGPALITASDDQDLHINPAVGGGQYLVLVANRWPGADGAAGQVLTTDGSGVLSFTTQSTLGSPAPETSATTGFAYIPVTSGTPTEIPDAISGYVPMLADSDGEKLWVYIGAAWKSIILS